MRLSTVIKRLEKEYEKAKDNKLVRKPISFALYRTWRWCDTYENAKRNRLSSDDKPETEYATKWISCDEMMPEECTWCIATFKDPDKGFLLTPRIAGYMGNPQKCTTEEGWIILDVTDEGNCNDYVKKLQCVAWLPLPEAYREENRNE